MRWSARSGAPPVSSSRRLSRQSDPGVGRGAPRSCSFRDGIKEMRVLLKFVPVVSVLGGFLAFCLAAPATGAVTPEQVENAIKRGVRYLRDRQRPDGSWV